MLKSNLGGAMQVDDKFFLDTVDAGDLSKFFSLVVVGVALALKEKALTVPEAERILFSPYMVSLLRQSGCADGLIDLVERGCEIEDIESLIPGQLTDVLDRIIKGSLREVESGSEALKDGRRLFAKIG
ncbi:DUF3969 family protein [Pseudomonas nitroreducens]|uniref:DUF3969 family protein n=1 Tax=Pseudomonas nitroreducens TaxID=46680 RepID=UPI00380E6F9B